MAPPVQMVFAQYDNLLPTTNVNIDVSESLLKRKTGRDTTKNKKMQI